MQSPDQPESGRARGRGRSESSDVAGRGGSEPDAPAGRWPLFIGAGVIVALSAGWFALAHLAMDEPTGDAIGEALGVMLALLVVASIVGAVVSGRGRPG